MSDEYNGAQGGTPATCYGSSIPPNLGSNPAVGGPGLSQTATPMVSPANPFQPCAPSGGTTTCPAPTCCGAGASSGGGFQNQTVTPF